MTTMALHRSSRQKGVCLPRRIVRFWHLAGVLALLSPAALAQQQTCAPSFTYRIGDPSPSPSSVTCTLTAASTALNYTLSPSAAWIVVTPTSGSIPANQTATITVSVNPTGLAGANYSGTIATTAVGYSITPFSVTLSVTAAAPPSPQISSALNAASFAIGRPLAPGVIFSVFGTSLTDGTTSSAPSIPLPTTLSGATVLVNGVAAPLYFASPTQINVEFPVELTGINSASIQVQVRSPGGSGTSPTFTVQVASSSPGVFTLNQNGTGPGLVFHATNFTLVCPAGRTDCTTSMAVPGETLSIYMTGLGQVNGSWISGQVPATPLSTVGTPTITIGGVQAQLSFAGLTTNFVGIYQVNVVVPLDVPGGNAVPVLVTLPDGRSSNVVTIPIQAPSSNSQNGGGPAGGTVLSLAINPNTPTTIYAGTRYGGVFKTTNGGINWGPTGDALLDSVGTIVIDPSNTATLYAGTGSGIVFKSVDSGTTWFYANSGLSPAENITTLVIDSSNPTTLYASTVAGGVYKTSNGGSSWTPVNSGLSNLNVGALAMDPSNHFVLYVYVSLGKSGVYKTTNGGLSWSLINSPLLSANSVSAFAFDQHNPGTIYAGGGVGVLKSTDSGATWASASPDMNGRSILALLIDPTNSNNLYAGLSPGNGSGIYKSTNAGANWTRVSPDIPSSDPYLWVYSLALNPATPTTIYAGTRYGVQQSTNAGNNWVYANAGITVWLVRQLVIDPSSPSTLYAAGDPLIFKTTNGGTTWNQSSSGYSANNFGGMAIDPSTPSTLYAISDLQGVFKTTNGGASWSLVASSPIFGGLGSVLVDRSNSANVYVAGGNPGGVYKSADHGQTWNPLGSLPGAYILAADAGNPSTLYCTTNSIGGIYKTINGGQTWAFINNGVSKESQTIVVADPINSGVVYLGTYYDGLFKSTNGGATWAPAGVSGLVLGISVDPSNPSTVYVATFGGLYKTTNGGASWQSLGNSLPEAALYHYGFAIDPVTPTNVYLATSYGVFKSIDGGQTWQPTGAN